jgi:sialic acid synthase SpsE
MGKRFLSNFKIGDRMVGEGQPVYFIADIGANFDGDLEKAKKLAYAAKQAGADVAKLQSFKAEKIVSGKGFASMQLKGIHGSWNRPIEEVFREAEFPREWHKEFFAYCREIGITPSSSPYDVEAVDLMEELGTDFYKIGSGDITWHEMVEYIAKRGKPVILATGASTLAEVDEAVRVLEGSGNREVAILQCITNYPSKIESANFNVLNTYRTAFDAVIGYSDHSPGDVVVLGAVALGAKVIVKHFSLNKNDKGPDHPHSMEPDEFARMVERTRELEKAMGTARKEVVEEESETVIVQRRGLCASRELAKGVVLTPEDIAVLRPALGILPNLKKNVVGKRLNRDIAAGAPIRWEDLD